MNFLSLFVLIPILMMAGLAIARDMKQIRTVAVTFSTLQLGLAIYTVIKYLAERYKSVFVSFSVRCNHMEFNFVKYVVF